MKLLFRRKHDGCILTPIQTLDSYVRLQNAAGSRVWWAKKDGLYENFDVLTHDIARGDVLRDIRDGSMWIVEYVGLHGLRMQSRKDGVAGMTYFGLVNYERVGRKYSLRDRQPHERSSAIADAVTNAQRHAQEYGVGFIRVERDGSMKAIDPRSVILK
ncbi:hypothetical protein JLBYU27_16 [Escherichia phage JLBYU27]|nr:hypothetical protein JLBYU27_16 [Escherichia phage JLBYU27]